MRCRAVGFIVTLALSIIAAPLAAAGQPAGKLPRIGWLSTRLPPSGSDLLNAFREGTAARAATNALTESNLLNAFREGLRERGYVEGQNIVIEYRWAEGRFERLPELAAELVRLPVDLIVTVGGPSAIRATQQATRTIPIVVPVMHEPVVMGFVASLARPGGNLTGQAFQDSELSTKRLEQLKEMVPNLSRIAALWDPTDGGATALHATEEAAQALGLALHVLEVRGPNDFARAFEAAHKAQAHALMQLASPLFSAHRKTIMDLLATSRLPATCEQRAFVVDGCLMTYGPSFEAMYRRAAYYVDRILKGAKPSDLPVEQPIKFELVINLKTAQALGLTITPTLLFQATEVIR